MKKKNQKRLSNKGFSLVELIVVIAIMAVLVGVLAPTLLGNIEKSRESKDMTTLDSVYSAIQTAYGDEAGNTEAKDTTKSYKAITSSAGVLLSDICVVGDAFQDQVFEYLKKKVPTVGSAQAKKGANSGAIRVSIVNDSIRVWVGSGTDNDAQATDKIKGSSFQVE